MFTQRLFSVFICLFGALAAWRLPAQPQSPGGDPREGISKSVVFSTDEPIDIPGAVLRRGSYVLRIKDGQAARDANPNLKQLEVLDVRQTYVVAEFQAMQVYDPSPADNTILTYYDGASGRRALKAWFHLSTNYSERPVYSGEQAAEISRNVGEAVLTMASVTSRQEDRLPAEVARMAAPSSAPGPGGPAATSGPSAATQDRSAANSAPETTQERAAAAPQAGSKPADNADASDGVAAEFPKTAGELPIVIWLGVTALACFIVFRLYWRDPAELRNARNSARARRVAAAAYQNYKLAQSSPGGRQA